MEEPRTRVHGPMEICKHRQSLIKAELRAIQPDGERWAVKLENIRPLDYFAMGEGKSIPIPPDQPSDRKSTPQEDEDFYKYCRVLVAMCVREVRSCYQEEEVDEAGKPTGKFGEWQEKWVPTKVVHNRAADYQNNEMHIDDFDFTDNVRRCYFALLADNDSGGEFREVRGLPFRSSGPSSSGVDREDLREVSA